MTTDIRYALAIAGFGLVTTIATVLLEAACEEGLQRHPTRVDRVKEGFAAVGMCLGVLPLGGGLLYVAYRVLWLFAVAEVR